MFWRSHSVSQTANGMYRRYSKKLRHEACGKYQAPRNGGFRKRGGSYCRFLSIFKVWIDFLFFTVFKQCAGEACLRAARARRQRSRHAGRWPSRATSRSRGPLGERSLFDSCARRGPTMELPFAEVAARRRLSLACRMLTPEPRWRASNRRLATSAAAPISKPLVG